MAIKIKSPAKLFILTAVIAVIAAVITTAAIVYSDFSSVHIADGSTDIVIDSGDSAASIADFLHEHGIVKYPRLFKLTAHFTGYDKNIKAGDITLTDGMSYTEILKSLTEITRSGTRIVIPEGYELSQIKNTLIENGFVTEEEFDAALDPSAYDYRFLQDIPDRENKLEGYLFPSTYDVQSGMSAHDIVDMMLYEFNQQFGEEYYEKASQMGYSVDQIITMASIIERETDSETERAKVAGVFYNRLQQNMQLQSCATVQYLLGERKPVLSVADTQIESPYNTYLNYGLPIGPICNPGAECIAAALYPEETDALFFVLGSDGNHIFSRTYEEHLAAMENTQPKYSVEEN